MALASQSEGGSDRIFKAAATIDDRTLSNTLLDPFLGTSLTELRNIAQFNSAGQPEGRPVSTTTPADLLLNSPYPAQQGAAAESVSFCAAEAEKLHYEGPYKPGTAHPGYNAEKMLGELNDGTSVWSHLSDAEWVYNHLDLVKDALKNARVHDNRDEYMQRLWRDVANHSDGAIRFTPAYTNFWNNYVGSQLQLVKGVVFNRSLLD